VKIQDSLDDYNPAKKRATDQHTNTSISFDHTERRCLSHALRKTTKPPVTAETRLSESRTVWNRGILRPTPETSSQVSRHNPSTTHQRETRAKSSLTSPPNSGLRSEFVLRTYFFEELHKEFEIVTKRASFERKDFSSKRRLLYEKIIISENNIE
jgi:hypothetical protein